MNKKKCKFCGDSYQNESPFSKFCCEDCRDSFSRYKKHNSIFDKTPNTWNLTGFNQTIKDMVVSRDGYQCYICGKRTNLHVHHIIPRKDGGKHTLENLVTLCGSCHRSVESGNVEKAIYKCVKRAINNCLQTFAK